MPPHERMFHHEHAAKLDDPDRERWLPSSDLVTRLGARPGMRVADVGAGTGYFAIPLARAVAPGGRVFAVDLQPEMLERLRPKIAPELDVKLVVGSAERTTLEDHSVDAMLLANVWHEIDDRPAALAEARRILRDGAKLFILDWRPDADPENGPPLDHRVSADDAVRAATAAGFGAAPPERFGAYHYLVVATP
jgi:ubiquinone/menaquinone biosynthesis C-methylase UbiE